MRNKKLYKSRYDIRVDGVCSGLAEYFGIDATLVRVLWVFFACFGAGIIAYIICMIVMPREPYTV